MNDVLRCVGVRRAFGALPHLGEAALARDDEEDVLEDHPGRVLDPAPLASDEDAVDRLRPEDAAYHVIKADDVSGWDEYPPIPIKGEKGQRAKDMEMGLDSAPGKVDEQR